MPRNCPYCNKELSTRQWLDYHIERYHRTSPDEYLPTESVPSLDLKQKSMTCKDYNKSSIDGGNLPMLWSQSTDTRLCELSDDDGRAYDDEYSGGDESDYEDNSSPDDVGMSDKSDIFSSCGVGLQKHADILKVLAMCKNPLKNAIINAGDKALIETLCDCAQNILNGSIKMTSHEKACLRRHKHLLRNLAHPQCLQQKKEVLQKGGFLSSLLAPVLGIIG